MFKILDNSDLKLKEISFLRGIKPMKDVHRGIGRLKEMLADDTGSP